MDPGIPHEVPDRPQFHEMRGHDVVPSRPRIADAMGDRNVLYQFLTGWARATDLANRVEPRDESARQWEYNINEDMKQEDWMAEQYPDLMKPRYLFMLGNELLTYEQLKQRLEDSGG
jgi:hypothetical protein